MPERPHLKAPKIIEKKTATEYIYSSNLNFYCIFVHR